MSILAMAKIPAIFQGWFPFMQGLTPGVSVAVILGFFIFAAGFVMTLISTLKAQWGPLKPAKANSSFLVFHY
ncbi:MAG: hypothetical protein AJITA_00484 [Acetilactobacillus jinshanensis]